MADEQEKKFNDQKAALIQKRMQELEKEDGVFIKDLDIGDEVVLVAQHRFYLLQVIDPASYKVRVVTDDPDLVMSFTAFVYGSIFSTEADRQVVKTGWIGFGRGFVLGPCILPPVKSIFINGKELFPLLSQSIH